MMTTVYCVGAVDYDVRVELPLAVYSTLAKAQAHFPGVEWVPDEEYEGEWNGREPGRSGGEVVIRRYEVDGRECS